VVSLEQYDTEIAKEFAGPTASSRPVSSVVRTITGN